MDNAINYSKNVTVFLLNDTTFYLEFSVFARLIRKAIFFAARVQKMAALLCRHRAVGSESPRTQCRAAA